MNSALILYKTSTTSFVLGNASNTEVNSEKQDSREVLAVVTTSFK